jgi:hypothetical protein
VRAYIETKVERLATLGAYKEELKEFLKEHLLLRAEGTFLWVSLACCEMEGLPSISVKDTLQQLPMGLFPLYGRILEVAKRKAGRHAKPSIEILRAVIAAFRPLTLQELGIVADLPVEHRRDPQALMEYVELCGSFLTVRQEIVYFVHQSAKDYLLSLTERRVVSPGLENGA